MSSEEEFNLGEFLEQITSGFADALKPMTRLFNAQAIIGHMMNGDVDAARKVFSEMDLEDVQALSVVTSVTTSFLDEELDKRKS